MMPAFIVQFWTGHPLLCDFLATGLHSSLDCQFWNKADQASLIRMEQFDLKVIDIGRFPCKIKGWNLTVFRLSICELKGDVGIL